jgi:hypothetical protein
MKVKTNFVGEVEFDMESPTLQKVVMALSDKAGFPIISPKTGEIRGDFRVYLNGEEHEKIDTNPIPLNGKDEVEVTIVILAGG